MSRRYGRNQRRAHREALAAAQAEVSDLKVVNEQLRREIDRLRDTVDEIVERLIFVLGPDSAIIPYHRQHRLGPFDFIPRRWAIPDRALRLFAPLAEKFDPREMRQMAVDLVELVMRLDREPHGLRAAIRILVKHPLYDEFEGQAAILVDADTFRKHGLSGRDVDMLFEMYREQLKSFIAGNPTMRPEKERARG